MHMHSLTHTDTHSEIGRANIIAPVLQAETESERWSHLPKLTLLVSIRIGILSQVFWAQDQGITYHTMVATR